MIYKTTSSQIVIGKLYRDLNLNDPNYEDSFIEWIGEALDFIGSYTQLETKITDIPIENFKSPIPTDLVILNGITYKDKPLSTRHSNILSEDSPNRNSRYEESFSINPNFFVFSFEEGIATISYQSIPVDDKGYPLIPDNQYFREALFWYCFKQMLMSGYQPKMKDLGYMFADNKWKFYCTAARNQANYPDVTQYERFKDVWVGLIHPKQTRTFSKDEDYIDPSEYIQ